MPKPTPKQLVEFADYAKNNHGKPFEADTLRGVVDDDASDAQASLEKRMGHNRQYNHPPEKIEKRKILEAD